MKNSESLFKTAFSAFLNTFFKLLGLFFALIIFLYLLSSIQFPNSKKRVKTPSTIEVVANHKLEQEPLKVDSDLILSIPIQGMIGSKQLNQKTIEDLLLETEDSLLKGRIRAILLEVQSSGGSAFDSDQIYHLIKNYKERLNIPVFAYIDGICASGGVYIAVCADEIFASDISLIGSIGVVLPPFFNVTDPLKKLGIETETISRGMGKDAMNPFREWQKNESQNFQEIAEFFYLKFVSIVEENRPKLSKHLLINEYGAKVFPAPQALKYGFIDTISSSKIDVIQKLAEKAELEDYQVIRITNFDWIKELFEMGAFFKEPKVIHQLPYQMSLAQELKKEPLYLYQGLGQEHNLEQGL